jgi:hypothetical protein
MARATEAVALGIAIAVDPTWQEAKDILMIADA